MRSVWLHICSHSVSIAVCAHRLQVGPQRRIGSEITDQIIERGDTYNGDGIDLAYLLYSGKRPGPPLHAAKKHGGPPGQNNPPGLGRHGGTPGGDDGTGKGTGEEKKDEKEEKEKDEKDKEKKEKKDK